MREVGVLLIAFAPLDVALTHGQAGQLNFLFLFLGLGISLFTGSLRLEKRRSKDASSNRGLLTSLILGATLFAVGLIRVLGG